MIGFTLVSIGTDLPEIVNSIVSCALGHGNINAGGPIGSVLTQLIMIFGILPFFGASFKVKRRDSRNRGMPDISAYACCLHR